MKCKLYEVMRKRIFPLILLVAYLFLLIKVLVFKEVALIRIGELKFNFGGIQVGPANLIPFRSILPYVLGERGFLIAVLNIGGNIVALVPLGFLVSFVFGNLNAKKIFLLSVASGLTIELTQLVLRIGIFDIDDVILNGLGVLIGFWKYKMYNGFSKPIQKIIATICLTLLSGLVILYIIAYNQIIHLPFGLEPSISEQKQKNIPTNHADTNCCDLCKGTGGTGGIVEIRENAFTLVHKDGKKEIIKLNTKTIVKNSAGPATPADLKLGDRVTVIIDDTETASMVLICGIK